MYLDGVRKGFIVCSRTCHTFVVGGGPRICVDIFQLSFVYFWFVLCARASLLIGLYREALLCLHCFLSVSKTLLFSFFLRGVQDRFHGTHCIRHAALCWSARF